MKINTRLLTNRPKRKLKQLKGIIIHWTANVKQNAGAEAHYRYFENVQDRKANVHYVVDDSNIIQLIPDDEIAYHVGDPARKNVSLPIRDKLIPKKDNPNNYFIGIELCVNVNNDWTKTLLNVKFLLNELFKKHNLTINDVYRHYDITGKDCPNMYLPIKVENQLFEWSWFTFKTFISEPLMINEVIKEVPVEVIKEVPIITLPEFSTAELINLLFKKLFSRERK